MGGGVFLATRVRKRSKRGRSSERAFGGARSGAGARPVGRVGGARLGAEVALYGFKRIRTALHVQSLGGHNAIAARARAGAYAAARAQAEAPMVVDPKTSAYDAGYYGRAFDASWGEEARAAHRQGTRHGKQDRG